MKHHHPIDDILSSRGISGLIGQLRGYLKWIIAGAVVLFILGFVLIAVLIIGLFTLFFRTTSEQLPVWQNEGQAIFTEGQRWWEQRFNQEQQQLNDIQTQLNELQTLVETQEGSGEEQN